MRDALDPDHWVNGGECDHPHPDALAMEALDAEIERLKQALHDARIENSGQAAEIGLNEAKRWIPVEERLPEANTAVLTRWRDGVFSVEWRFLSGEWTTGSTVTQRLPEANTAVLTRWRDGVFSVEWRFPSGEWITGSTVTHWMPLPEPPKEVQG